MSLSVNRVLVGDALAVLKTLPAGTADTVVTSPPYYAVRDYEVDGQLGLETNVQAWVDNLLAVADEVGRVLKPTGSMWLNVADSYSRGSRYGAAAKSLLLGPQRLVLALAERGWIVRNVVVWSKPDPMPSSVKDRLTCSYEVLFLLTRQASYFFDLDTIRVPHRTKQRPAKTPPAKRSRAAGAGPLAGDQSGLERLKASGLPGHPLGKSPGDHWHLPTSRFRGGHHATYPEALVERPVLAACPERVCTGCGQPWLRAPAVRQAGRLALLGKLVPSCRCALGWQPGLVLDPFIGSGTTAVVAERLGRRWLGIELNPVFAMMAEQRVAAARQDQRQRAA